MLWGVKRKSWGKEKQGKSHEPQESQIQCGKVGYHSQQHGGLGWAKTAGWVAGKTKAGFTNKCEHCWGQLRGLGERALVRNAHPLRENWDYCYSDTTDQSKWTLTHVKWHIKKRIHCSTIWNKMGWKQYKYKLRVDSLNKIQSNHPLLNNNCKNNRNTLYMVAGM